MVGATNQKNRWINDTCNVYIIGKINLHHQHYHVTF